MILTKIFVIDIMCPEIVIVPPTVCLFTFLVKNENLGIASGLHLISLKAQCQGLFIKIGIQVTIGDCNSSLTVTSDTHDVNYKNLS